MDERFKIFIEQLKGGGSEKINLSCDSDFLELHEEELHFKAPVTATGEAYLADSELILHFNAKAHALIPCSICNAPVDVEVEVNNFYHAEPLLGIKGGSFDYREILREAILLELPLFAECKQGNCPQRLQLAKYLKPSKPSNEEGYRPFADINFDQFKP